MTDQIQLPPARATKHIFSAIQQVKVALALSGIGKNRQNSEQRFNFRGIDDILNELSTLTAQAQIAIFPFVEEREYTDTTSGSGKRIQHVRLSTTFQFVSLVDGSRLDCKIPSEASDYSDKATNKAISFALKYACITVFCIPVVGNEDGDFSSVGNEVDSGHAATEIAAAKPAAAKKSPAKAKAAPAAKDPTPNAVILKLQGLDNKLADKAAELIKKAYKLKSISDVDASDARIPEILKRLDTYLAKGGSVAPQGAPATASDIPE